tara:strand:+ start:1651 stop:1914 length:264 start_codon:yes stop_codon:yes gene_type:complete
MVIKEIIRDYKFMKKRIEIEYDMGMNQGGIENDIHEAWEAGGVGFDNSCPGDIGHFPVILAILRHPIKSHWGMVGFYFEKKGRESFD